ncbi:MAG: hypothetical protein DRI57_18020 [Deltaproteobacteria bacterium]|nr:MAG: hypothetical protein DRI57_18020 [Deltaproteobacteria bacterium]
MDISAIFAAGGYAADNAGAYRNNRINFAHRAGPPKLLPRGYRQRSGSYSTLCPRLFAGRGLQPHPQYLPIADNECFGQGLQTPSGEFFQFCPE